MTYKEMLDTASEIQNWDTNKQLKICLEYIEYINGKSTKDENDSFVDFIDEVIAEEQTQESLQRIQDEKRGTYPELSDIAN